MFTVGKQVILLMEDRMRISVTLKTMDQATLDLRHVIAMHHLGARSGVFLDQTAGTRVFFDSGLTWDVREDYEGLVRQWGSLR